ncbi:aminoglycoside 6'-N-acetyltransferase [Anaerosporobacter sp.]|uniref:aminoglycoside 6'-N-acetyltransferase n=1 Tax=Anaerosporobacter sp. TaxID=1872529 RepID=UPI00286F99C4|nr:aminoglycoside 6'-N-acetyltransferase [Anaerosporobacter sp.]
MIVQVNEKNETLWAELCVSLWPTHTIEEMLQERRDGLFSHEFIYYIDDEAVGFMSLSIRSDYVEGTDSSPVGYLEGIYVKPNYRKQGIAKALVDYAKKWAKEQECTELASDCELDNETSILFHKQLGFQEQNRIVCFTMKCE